MVGALLSLMQGQLLLIGAGAALFIACLINTLKPKRLWLLGLAVMADAAFMLAVAVVPPTFDAWYIKLSFARWFT